MAKEKKLFEEEIKALGPWKKDEGFLLDLLQELAESEVLSEKHKFAANWARKQISEQQTVK